MNQLQLAIIIKQCKNEDVHFSAFVVTPYCFQYFAGLFVAFHFLQPLTTFLRTLVQAFSLAGLLTQTIALFNPSSHCVMAA